MGEMDGMRVAAFGELLWDVFDRPVMGGAPFNFSAHLAQLGESVALLSAVGEDDAGRDALELAERYGVESTWIGRSAYPTGLCRVALDNSGQPRYTLVEPAAYDDIRLTPEQEMLWAARSPEVFYFGTLGQRGAVSRQTLRRLLVAGSYRAVWCDVNIRPPFYDAQTLRFSLEHCTMLKCSREEMALLAQEGLSVLPSAMDDPAAIAVALSTQYPQLRQVVVTLDSEGALLYDTATDRFWHSCRPRSRCVSAVGAGDSFCAAFVQGYLHGLAWQDCLDRAVYLSDYVVTQTEAVPTYPPELRTQLAIR